MLDKLNLEVKDGEIVNAGQSVQGTFTLAGASSNGRSLEDGTPEVGDIVAVYEGTHPDERTADGDDEANTAPISYVRITAVNGNEYSYEGVETQDVLDMPEIFPVSYFADTDNDAENNSITVPGNTFIYAGAAFNEAGFDSETEPEEGDYIAFYTGYLNTEADTDDEIKVGDPHVEKYALIKGITQDEDGNYVITYEEATLDQIMINQSSYTSQDMNMGELLSPEELRGMEAEIEDEVMESGMAEEVAQAVVNAAMTGESLEVLQEELGLTELSVTPNGSSSSAAGSGSSSANITVKVTGAKANVKTTTERYDGSGLTVKLEISFTVTINQTLELEFTIALEQQLKIVLTASVDTVCEWLWGFIPYPDWVVSASIDVYSYTGLDIDINITTDDAVTEVTDYVDMIKDLLEEGGDESDAETFASRYQAMLENDSDWVELFKYRLMHEKKSLAKIVNFSMEISFVVSANVNVYVGVDFWYEIGRRYSFTMQLLNSQTSNNTVSLIPEEYELEVYVMGMLGLRAGLRIDLAASLIHKKVAGVGISAEAGAYIELYGYFFYKLHYLEGSESDADKRESQAGGNLYVEVGIYVEVGAEVEALGGLITWMPTIYSQTWPLWTAGNQYSILGFHEPAGGIGTLEFGYTDIYSVPSTVFTMDVLDMKTGKVSQTNYANIAYGNNFTIENTNSEIAGGWLKSIAGIIPMPFWQYQLWAAHDIDDMNRYESGQLIITYSDPTIRLAFNTEPLRRVVNYNWDQVGDEGFNFVLSSEINQISFYDFQGTKLDYDLDDFYRYGYERLGWLNINGNYEGLDIGSAENIADIPGIEDYLVKDEDLPTHIEGEDLYYIEVSRQIDVPYTVRHHYQALDGSYPESGDGVVTTTHSDGRSEQIITPGKTGEPFGTAAQQTDGFGTPFTRGITIITDENAVGDLYYPRNSYTATFKYYIEGESKPVKTVTNRLKYGQALNVPAPSLDGYHTKGWGIADDATMPANNVTYTATFTPNNDTPYVVEHYLQQDDGSYVLAENGRVPGSGETGKAPTVEKRTFEGYDEGSYDTNLTIAGDGSTVVKVRYEKTGLHTATFYTKDEAGKDVVIGKSYYYENGTINVPDSVREANPGYRPTWVNEDSESVTFPMTEAPDYDTSFTVDDWYAAEDTEYTVVHMQQDANAPDNYVEVERETMTGTTGDPVKVTLIEHNEGEFEPGKYEDGLTIDGAGTTVVEVKYDRCEYTLTYDLNAEGDQTAQFADGSTTPKTEPVLFGATLDLLGSGDVLRTNYALTGWTTDAAGAAEFIGTTMPADNLTLYAVWTSGITYKVINKLEKAELDPGTYEDGTGPTVKYYDQISGIGEWIPNVDEEVEYRVATEGSTVTVVPTEYEHFNTPESREVTVSEDGTTEVTFDYTRKTHHVTVYDATDGNKELWSGDIRYGSDLTDQQFKYGYLPGGMYTDAACTQPYSSEIDGGEVRIYVKEWTGATYSVRVGLLGNHGYDYYEDFWSYLEGYGATIEQVPNSIYCDINLQYDKGITMPESETSDDGIVSAYKIYLEVFNSSVSYNNYEVLLGPGGSFDTFFTGQREVEGATSSRYLYMDYGDSTDAAQYIYDAADLLDIEKDFSIGYRTFELADDIDMTGVNSYIDIYRYELGFASDPNGISLNGNGYTISNYTNTKGVGLFRFLPGASSIMNLTLDSFNVSDGDITEADHISYDQFVGIGMLVNDVLAEREDEDWNHDYVPADISVSNVTVKNSSITSSTPTGYTGGSKDIGGLIGYCANANMSGCVMREEYGVSVYNEYTKGAFIGRATGVANFDEACFQNLQFYDDMSGKYYDLKNVGFEDMKN